MDTSSVTTTLERSPLLPATPKVSTLTSRFEDVSSQIFRVENVSLIVASSVNGSSQTKSLTQAFMGIELATTLKGLQTKLINSANLTVLPSTGVDNNFANSIVSLANPFTSPLMITNIQSNITSHGLFVGSIVQDTQFMATGKASSVSPILDL